MQPELAHRQLSSAKAEARAVASTTRPRYRRRRPTSALDTIIAATAEANGRIVVADNERNFPGIETFNPLRPTA